MKRWIPWMAAAIVVVLVAGGALRAISARQAKQTALAESTATTRQVVMDIAPEEVNPVRRQNLSLDIPLGQPARRADGHHQGPCGR